MGNINPAMLSAHSASDEVVSSVSKTDANNLETHLSNQELIRLVGNHSVLYDSRHRHRGLIWSAIANELHEKATKLIKVWLLLQTYFEWELMQMDDSNSHLMKELSFRGVVNLINVLKIMPELDQIVNGYEGKASKSQRYHALWLRVSTRLQDKWYSENVIGCLYRVLSNRHGRRVQKRTAIKPGDSPPPPKKILTAKYNQPFDIDRAGISTTSTTTAATAGNCLSAFASSSKSRFQYIHCRQQ
ncbi:GH18311 [Drosophila grimshawi]|uniref:GH18311 n=1 Tax=Drosophila grimshawi TaxID=7222 RepID=B4K0N4_DROGR|nr:GH18311 [Drosophila grimshawi]